MRLARVLWLALVCTAGCTDEALVGEGTACPAICPTGERCRDGACVPVSGGAAGDDSDTSDEGSRDHEDDEHEGEHPDDGEASEGPGGQPGEPVPDP